MLATPVTLPADPVTWIGTSSTWNSPGNWDDSANLNETATVIFDGSTATTFSTTLDAGFEIAGIQVVNPAGAVTIANGTDGSLAIGAGGIDLSTATQNLTFSNTITVGADQEWQVASGRTLGFNLSNFATFGLGGHTVTKSGSGTLNLSGANISNGTLVLAGGTTSLSGFSSLSTGIALGATVQIQTGAQLDVVRSSGNFTLSGVLQLDGGTFRIAPGTSNASNLNGTINVTANGGSFVLANNSSGAFTQTVNSALTGSGTLNIRNESTVGSILALSGDFSAFTGAFDINGSTGQRLVRIDSSAVNNAQSWTVRAGNTLRLNAADISLGTVSLAAATLNLTSSATNATISAINGSSAGGSVISLDAGSDLTVTNNATLNWALTILPTEL